MVTRQSNGLPRASHRRGFPRGPGPTVVVLACTLLCVVVTGCKKSGAPVEADAGVALDTEGALSPEAASDQVAPPPVPEAVSAATLEAYIRVQREALAEVRSLSPVPADVAARLQKWTDAEVAARARVKLPDTAATGLHDLVGDVLARRAITKAMKPEELASRLEALREKLGPNQQSVVEPLQKDLEAGSQRARLADERTRYGDAPVDLVLAREAELTELWEGRLAWLFTPGKGEKR